MRKLLLVLVLLLLVSQLQHIHASRHYPSPPPANPPCNEDQFVHKENLVEQDKHVAIVIRRGGGGGGGGGGGHGGGGGGGGRGGGGYIIILGGGSDHHNGVSSCCIHPYFEFLATMIVLANLF